MRVGRGLLGFSPKDGSPPGGRGARAGESSGLPGPGPRRGRTGAEAGVGSGSRSAGSREGRRGATAGALFRPQTGRAVPGRRGKPSADGGFPPETPVSRALWRAEHRGSGQRQRGTPGRIGRVCRGKTGAIRGKNPGFRAAYRAHGAEKPFSGPEKPGFPGDCPRRVTGSRLCARSRTRSRAHGQARFAHV